MTHSNIKKEFSDPVSLKGSRVYIFFHVLSWVVRQDWSIGHWWAFYWLRKGHRIKSTSMNLVWRQQRKDTETLLFSAPPAMGRWGGSHTEAAYPSSFSRKPGSRKVPSVNHVLGSESPDDTSSWIPTTPPIHGRERIFNNPSLLSLPGDLEKALSRARLFNPMHCSLPGSSIPVIFPRVQEWVDISFSRGSSQPRDRTQVSRIADRPFTLWATRASKCYLSV